MTASRKHDYDKMAELAVEGHTAACIGRQIGCVQGQVSFVLRQRGVELTTHRCKPELGCYQAPIGPVKAAVKGTRFGRFITASDSYLARNGCKARYVRSSLVDIQCVYCKLEVIGVRLSNLRTEDYGPVCGCSDGRAYFAGSKRHRQVLLDFARMRSKKFGVPFFLTLDSIQVPERCPVFGFPLQIGSRRPEYNSPTLDRIVPELGYVEKNVIVVSKLANGIKSSATPAQILAVGKFYAELIQSRGLA